MPRELRQESVIQPEGHRALRGRCRAGEGRRRVRHAGHHVREGAIPDVRMLCAVRPEEIGPVIHRLIPPAPVHRAQMARHVGIEAPLSRLGRPRHFRSHERPVVDAVEEIPRRAAAVVYHGDIALPELAPRCGAASPLHSARYSRAGLRCAPGRCRPAGPSPPVLPRRPPSAHGGPAPPAVPALPPAPTDGHRRQSPWAGRTMRPTA